MTLSSNSGSASVLRCKSFRLRILELSQKVQALHVAPAFSCIELLDFVYNVDKRGVVSRSDFDFILSKGHGAIAQYVVLEHLGIISSEDLDRYCHRDGFLGAHPDRGNPGIVASTGSLGHGIGLAVGMAKAEKLKHSNREIFVVASDGELQEGSSWEALMMAANLELNNLNVLVDCNDFGGMDKMSVHHKAFFPLDEKFKAFGFSVAECDGHDTSAISAAHAQLSRSLPRCIIAKTVKGKGVSFMENVPIWHYRSPNDQELEIAISEIEASDA